MTDRPAVLRAYDEVQHDPLTIPPDVGKMSIEDAVEAITDWFFENFEDPAQSTPHDSSEGGYIYIWGGPYDTNDIVENVFADTASEELIAAAIEELETVGSDWVPSSGRRQPPEEDFHDEPDTRELHGEVLRRIGELEGALARVPRLPPGIGHNLPPEPLELEPLDTSDRAEIADALAVLKAQPIEPADKGDAATEAHAKLETNREKLVGWLAKQGSVFTTEAVKEAGKQFGKWAPPVFWLWVADLMFGVSNAVGAWVKAIKVPF